MAYNLLNNFMSTIREKSIDPYKVNDICVYFPLLYADRVTEKLYTEPTCVFIGDFQSFSKKILSSVINEETVEECFKENWECIDEAVEIHIFTDEGDIRTSYTM